MSVNIMSVYQATKSKLKWSNRLPIEYYFGFTSQLSAAMEIKPPLHA